MAFNHRNRTGSFKEKVIYLILRRPLRVIALTALIATGASLFLPRIELDNSIDAFFDKQSKSYVDFQTWKEQFGSDQVVIIAFRDEDIFSVTNLSLISRLTAAFESLKYVDNVTSLTTVNDIVGYESDFIVGPLIEDIPSFPEELKELKKQALSNPLYIKNVLSEDAKTAAIIVELEHNPSFDDSYKKETITDISRILKEEFPEGRKYYVSGFTAIEVFYALYMQNDLKMFLPLILAIIICILYVSFRRPKIIILPLITIVVSLVLTMAFFYFCGFSINNVTTAVPPILIAIAIADSIHLISESIQKKRGAAKNGVNEDSFLSGTMKSLWPPCLLTTLTTAVGFWSLAISRIPPVRELGIVMGAGVFFAIIVTFTFLPALAKKWRLLETENEKNTGATGFPEEKFDRFLNGIGAFVERRKTVILIATAVLVCLCVWGICRIKIETSVLEYFKKDSPIYEATTFIEENLSGVHFLNISLKAEEDDYFKQPPALRAIGKLQEFLAGITEVDKTTSVADYVKEINKSFHNENPGYYEIPDSRNLIAQYLLLYGATDLDDFVDSRWRWTTVSVRLKEHSTVKLKMVISRINDYLDDDFNLPVRKEIVGQTALEMETNEAVTRGQVQSLSLALLVIFGMMFIVFRSVSVGLVSIIPNILPILVNFGIMGLVGIRLDSATSIISVIGIGIIVDDTIHFLHSFREELKNTGDYTRAMYGSLARKGRPIIFTSVILFAGFGVVFFSRFIPTSHFGLLSALLMLNALWADLVVLPSILLVLKPKFR